MREYTLLSKSWWEAVREKQCKNESHTHKTVHLDNQQANISNADPELCRLYVLTTMQLPSKLAGAATLFGRFPHRQALIACAIAEDSAATLQNTPENRVRQNVSASNISTVDICCVDLIESNRSRLISNEKQLNILSGVQSCRPRLASPVIAQRAVERPPRKFCCQEKQCQGIPN